jgi:hypothetical protein
VEKRDALQATRTFSIGSLMLLILQMAVWLAAFRISPGLGVFFLVLTVPTLVRTFITLSRWTREGREISTTGKFVVYLISLAVVVTTGFFAFWTFVLIIVFGNSLNSFVRYQMALSPGLGNIGVAAALFLALIAAGYVAYVVVKNLWSIED